MAVEVIGTEKKEIIEVFFFFYKHLGNFYYFGGTLSMPLFDEKG
jgi:hypothetical protein